MRIEKLDTLYQQDELWLLRELVAYSLHMLLVQLERVSAANRRKAVTQRPRRSQLVHVGKRIMHEPATTCSMVLPGLFIRWLLA